MLVFKTEASLRDHIRNYMAGKRIYSDSETLPAPHAIYPVVEHRGVRTQFLPGDFTVFTNAAIDIQSLLGVGRTLQNATGLPATSTTLVSQHVLETGPEISVTVCPLIEFVMNFTNVIYDPDDVVEAEDGARLTREQCEPVHRHRIFRCSQNVLAASGFLHDTMASADTPIYCETRGWTLQIARETCDYNQIYDSPFIPLVANKIIASKEQLKGIIDCTKCPGKACGIAYRVGTSNDYICAACAGTIPHCESLRSAACSEPPLKSPRDLLILPATIETRRGIRIVVTRTPICTYIGVPGLWQYLAATDYEGLPLPDPVLYKCVIA